MLRAAKLTRLALKVREALSICVSGRLLAVAVCVERLLEVTGPRWSWAGK